MLRTIAGQTSWVEPYPPNAKCRTSSSQSGRLIPENTIVTDTAMQPRIAIPARCARRDGDPTSTVVAAFMMDGCATQNELAYTIREQRIHHRDGGTIMRSQTAI